MAEKQEMIYEGRAKKVFATDDPSLLILRYKDDASAYNGLKTGMILGKGALNNQISAYFLKYLSDHGVHTHFVRQLNESESLVRRAEMIPMKVIVRNRAAGSIVSRLGLREGTVFEKPIVEFWYKNMDLDDPMLNADHIACLKLATPQETEKMAETALKVNVLLTELMAEKGIDLIDFKLEFGRDEEGIVLADGISPDTCRFWDSRTRECLDKDRFREDMGDVEDAYREIFNRLIGGEKHD